MEACAPTKEQLSKFDYEPPRLDQVTDCPAGRVKSFWERIKLLEPEHHQAIKQLEKCYFGRLGVDVSESHERVDEYKFDYEFSKFEWAGKNESARKAVGSPRVWKALICQIERTLTPQDIGHQWAGIEGRQGAKSFGEGLIIAGLDALCIHWGYISRPPD